MQNCRWIVLRLRAMGNRLNFAKAEVQVEAVRR